MVIMAVLAMQEEIVSPFLLHPRSQRDLHLLLRCRFLHRLRLSTSIHIREQTLLHYSHRLKQNFQRVKWCTLPRRRRRRRQARAATAGMRTSGRVVIIVVVVVKAAAVAAAVVTAVVLIIPPRRIVAFRAVAIAIRLEMLQR